MVGKEGEVVQVYAERVNDAFRFMLVGETSVVGWVYPIMDYDGLAGVETLLYSGGQMWKATRGQMEVEIPKLITRMIERVELLKVQREETERKLDTIQQYLLSTDGGVDVR